MTLLKATVVVVIVVVNVVLVVHVIDVVLNVVMIIMYIVFSTWSWKLLLLLHGGLRWVIFMSNSSSVEV